MNPIVVIGLVSVVVAGMYSTYDGLEKQAEIAALHADMLARQHAEHSVFVHGEIDDGKHIILINDGPQAAELVQVRAYDASVDDPPLLGTWQVSYELPPLGRFNLSAATTPAPPPDLTGTTLETSLDADTSYRGVTSAGGIFEIEYVPPTQPSIDGAYGNVAVYAQGSSRHTASNPPQYDFHHGERPSAFPCRWSGSEWYRYDVYDQPFYTGTSVGSWAGFPVGNPTWVFWMPTTYSGASPCTSPTPGNDPTNPANLQKVTIGVGTTGAFQVPASSSSPGFQATHTVNSITADVPYDGDVLIRVLAPVSGTVTASYDGYSTSVTCQDSYVNSQGTNPSLTGCSCMTMGSDDVTSQLASWQSSVSAPSITASLPVRLNGASVGTFTLYTATPVAVLEPEAELTRTNAAIGGTCTYRLEADIDAFWKYDASLSGTLSTTVSEGDQISIGSGNVRLSYIHGGSASSASGVLDVGDMIVTVGQLNDS